MRAALGIILAAGAIALPGQSLVMSLPRQSQRATGFHRARHALGEVGIAANHQGRPGGDAVQHPPSTAQLGAIHLARLG